MLQRAASNAYSWWWASHIRTKQSKWLEQNLQDMGDKVTDTLKIIDEDGDSFAKRAEMYYKKRPELINFVEESYRAYRALAERYDHISKELQNANRTIASIFPEQVQFAMDDEDDENFPEKINPSHEPDKPPKDLPDIPKPTIPKVPKIPKKDFKAPPMFVSKKGPLKRTASSARTVVSSGLSKTEAMEEIDELQKGILVLQTEKEFVKSSYESGLSKYWEIERRITEMQGKVCSLQDEYSIGRVIEDDEAQKLMVAAALKSCQQTLIRLQETQRRSAEEARIEYQRIKEAHEKLETLKDKLLQQKRDRQELTEGQESAESTGPGVKHLDQQFDTMEQEGHDWELLREKMKEDLKLNSNTSFTVTELAEKIDDLVDKVITLETAVSSQTALVNGLRSETDKLQAHIRILEEEKGALIDGSDNTSNKLRLLEEELHRVKNLNQSVEDKNNHLQTHFTEVTCNLDHLSVKLESVKPAEEVNSSTGLFQEVEAVTEAKPEMKFEEHEDKLPPGTISESSKDVKTEEEEKDEAQDLSNPVLAEEEKDNFVQSNQRNYNLDVLSEECQGPKQQKKDEKQELSQTVDNDVDIEPQEVGIWEDQPDLRQLFLNGSEDREKHLLEQYTTILRNFKEVKKKLCEAEKKNRDNLFESAMQIKELKNANALKDKEILSLRKKLWGLPPSNPDENLDNSLTEYAHSLQGGHEHRESIPGAASFRFSNNSFQNTEQQPVSNLSDEHNVEPTEKAEESTSFRFSNILYQNTEGQPVFNFSDEHNVEPTEKAEESTTQRSTDSPTKVVENGIKAIPVDESHAVSSIEEKFRADIDDLLEENLEFWLRFSTSFHQIQKFQTSIQDLQAELSKLKKNKKQDGSSKHQSLKSDARPIYAHLREIQTELTLWIEHNAVLKDELQSRFSSLCNIQEEISRISSAGSKAAETELNNYQAAKFQGEVLNMKQENNKVADELKAGLNCVESLQVEVEKTMEKMDEDFGFSESKSHHHHVHKRNPLNRSRIPLRSFLFGAKLKRQKPLLFSCMNPALQKQYSDLTSGLPP